VAGFAARTLWEVDRETNMVFSTLVAHPQQILLALRVLAEMGDAARPGIPNLIADMGNSNHTIRQQAEAIIRSLDPSALAQFNAQIKSNADANVSVLISEIQGTNEAVRAQALRAIKMYGADAKAAVPALIEFLKVPGTDYKRNENGLVADALREIGRPARPAVEILSTNYWIGSRAAMSALGGIGVDAKDALPFLEGELRSSVPQVRCDAADAITKIAPQNASEVIPILRELEHAPPLAVYYDDSKPYTAPLAFRPDPSSNYFRLAAEVSLWRLGVEPHPPIAGLVSELAKSKFGSEKENLVRLLGDIGPDAKPALPALEKLLAPFASPHAEAALAIRRIDPKEYDRLNLPGVMALP